MIPRLLAILFGLLLLSTVYEFPALAQETDNESNDSNSRFCRNFYNEKNQINKKMGEYKRLAKLNKDNHFIYLPFAKIYEHLCHAKEHVIAVGIRKCKNHLTQSEPLDECYLTEIICGPIEDKESSDF